jgi:hypothetical protein
MTGGSLLSAIMIVLHAATNSSFQVVSIWSSAAGCNVWRAVQKAQQKCLIVLWEKGGQQLCLQNPASTGHESTVKSVLGQLTARLVAQNEEGAAFHWCLSNF